MLPSKEALEAYIVAGAAAQPEIADWCKRVLLDAYAQTAMLDKLKADVFESLFKR